MSFTDGPSWVVSRLIEQDQVPIAVERLLAISSGDFLLLHVDGSIASRREISECSLVSWDSTPGSRLFRLVFPGRLSRGNEDVFVFQAVRRDEIVGYLVRVLRIASGGVGLDMSLGPLEAISSEEWGVRGVEPSGMTHAHTLGLTRGAIVHSDRTTGARFSTHRYGDIRSLYFGEDNPLAITIEYVNDKAYRFITSEHDREYMLFLLQARTNLAKLQRRVADGKERLPPYGDSEFGPKLEEVGGFGAQVPATAATPAVATPAVVLSLPTPPKPTREPPPPAREEPAGDDHHHHHHHHHREHHHHRSQRTTPQGRMVVSSHTTSSSSSSSSSTRSSGRRGRGATKKPSSPSPAAPLQAPAQAGPARRREPPAPRSPKGTEQRAQPSVALQHNLPHQLASSIPVSPPNKKQQQQQQQPQQQQQQKPAPRWKANRESSVSSGSSLSSGASRSDPEGLSPKHVGRRQNKSPKQHTPISSPWKGGKTPANTPANTPSHVDSPLDLSWRLRERILAREPHSGPGHLEGARVEHSLNSTTILLHKDPLEGNQPTPELRTTAHFVSDPPSFSNRHGWVPGPASPTANATNANASRRVNFSPSAAMQAPVPLPPTATTARRIPPPSSYPSSRDRDAMEDSLFVERTTTETVVETTRADPGPLYLPAPQPEPPQQYYASSYAMPMPQQQLDPAQAVAIRSREDSLCRFLIEGTELLKHTRGGRGSPHIRWFSMNVTTGKIMWRAHRGDKNYHSEPVADVIPGSSGVKQHRKIAVQEEALTFTIVTPGYRHNLVVQARDPADYECWVSGIALVLRRRDTGWAAAGVASPGANTATAAVIAPSMATSPAGFGNHPVFSDPAALRSQAGPASIRGGGGVAGGGGWENQNANNPPSPTTMSRPQPPVAAAQFQRPAQVEAMYDFAGQKKGDLEFRKGDIITVISWEGRNWWIGSVGARQGSFPLNMVRDLQTKQPIVPDQGRAAAQAGPTRPAGSPTAIESRALPLPASPMGGVGSRTFR